MFNIKLMNPKFYTKMNSSLKKFKTNILSVVIFIIGISAHSQNILISQGGTVWVSNNDNFYDAGGAKFDYKKTLSLSNIMKIDIDIKISKFKTRIGQSEPMKITKTEATC